jgi:hypothetical protein
MGAAGKFGEDFGFRAERFIRGSGEVVALRRHRLRDDKINLS